MSDEAMTRAARAPRIPVTIGQRRRRRRRRGADTGGNSVVEEVVMEEAQRRHGEPPGGVQPATAGDAVPGAPLRAAVLAGHDGDRDVALRLTGHRDPAVRAAAYGALARTGTLDVDALRRAL